MQRSRPALATIGPDGAYSLVSLDSDSKSFKNPLNFCCACCVFESSLFFEESSPNDSLSDCLSSPFLLPDLGLLQALHIFLGE